MLLGVVRTSYGSSLFSTRKPHHHAYCTIIEKACGLMGGAKTRYRGKAAPLIGLPAWVDGVQHTTHPYSCGRPNATTLAD